MLKIILIGIFTIVFLPSCTNEKEKKILGEARNYQCTSEASFIEEGKAVAKDLKSIVVDFNMDPNQKGSTLRHSYGKNEILVEFWSNDPNGASVTAYVKGFIFTDKWSAGVGSSAGLPDTFNLKLEDYKMNKKLLVQFKITCNKEGLR